MEHTSTRAATPADRPRSDAAHEMEEQIIVIGGGLAGLSAAHTVLEHGGRVLLLDKCPFLGGNSTKATSGINGALTRTQAAKGIQDSADKFEADIVKGAAGVGHTQPPAHTVPLAKVRRPPTNRRAFFLSRDICPRDSPPGSRADPPPHPAPNPPFDQVLAQGSGGSVDWLMEKFGLDLSLVSQLGTPPPPPAPPPPKTSP